MGEHYYDGNNNAAATAGYRDLRIDGPLVGVIGIEWNCAILLPGLMVRELGFIGLKNDVAPNVTLARQLILKTKQTHLRRHGPPVTQRA